MGRNTGGSTVKLYYRIGEVAGIVGVEPHVLRYWETEFPSIRPQKSRSGQRVYSRRDVDKLLRVKELLYAQRFTIAGARQRLKEAGKEGGASMEPPNPASPSLPSMDVASESAAEGGQASGDDPELRRLSQRLRTALLDVRCDVLRMLQGLDDHSNRMGRVGASEADSLDLEGSEFASQRSDLPELEGSELERQQSMGILGDVAPFSAASCEAERVLEERREGPFLRERECVRSRETDGL